ncbi:hypothetical protein B0H10DRAFT_2034011 [Mycena sp. CBHHK59/15]|nr:hypothetical protein B0H10DRAFT_2034011 [Mycena sp. CBHHK59/15]
MLAATIRSVSSALPIASAVSSSAASVDSAFVFPVASSVPGAASGVGAFAEDPPRSAHSITYVVSVLPGRGACSSSPIPTPLSPLPLSTPRHATQPQCASPPPSPAPTRSACPSPMRPLRSSSHSRARCGGVDRDLRRRSRYGSGSPRRRWRA